MHPLCDQDSGPSQTNLDALLSLPDRTENKIRFLYFSSLDLQIFVGLLISFQIPVSQVSSNASALIHINGLKRNVCGRCRHRKKTAVVTRSCMLCCLLLPPVLIMFSLFLSSSSCSSTWSLRCCLPVIRGWVSFPPNMAQADY